MRQVWLYIALAVTAPLAVIASACGGTSVLPTADPAQAATKTLAQGSSRISFEFSGAGLGARGIRGSGIYSYRSQSARVALDMSPFLGRLHNVTPRERQAIELLKGDNLYMRWPLLDRIAGMKPWIKFAFAGTAAGTQLQVSHELGSDDPTRYLEFLKATKGKLQAQEQERVRGVETTRYSATVDLDRVLSQVSPGLRRRLKPVIARLKIELGRPDLPLRVWVDGHGLVRRVQLHLQTVTGTRLSAGMRLEFYDFGAPLALQLPPARSVMSERAFERVTRSARLE